MSDAAPVTEQRSPGQALAAARVELKLSVADVSQQIKYGVKQIAAIEADDYAKLPGTTFVRGMIRSYAKLVHIDAAPLLADLGQRNVATAAAVDLHTGEQEPFVEGGRKSNRVYVLLSLAALLVVVAVAIEWAISPLDTGEVVKITPKSAQADASDSASVPASAPALATPPVLAQAGEARAADTPVKAGAPSAPTAPATGGTGERKRIELDFDQLSWVEVKQAGGKTLLSQLNQPGTRQVIEGVPPFEVVIGNAAKVRLTYDGAAVDLRPYFKVDVARLKLE